MVHIEIQGQHFVGAELAQHDATITFDKKPWGVIRLKFRGQSEDPKDCACVVVYVEGDAKQVAEDIGRALLAQAGIWSVEAVGG